MRGAWVEIDGYGLSVERWQGRSPCGERGLKCSSRSAWWKNSRRSPCGERGLKFVAIDTLTNVAMSLPVRGAWVEIHVDGRTSPGAAGRSPCGERGLKLNLTPEEIKQLSRSPCGERGLKCKCTRFFVLPLFRRSPCGERGLKCKPAGKPPPPFCCRSPCGERGLKCLERPACPPAHWSLPVRGAWVEILSCDGEALDKMVAPRAGSVG